MLDAAWEAGGGRQRRRAGDRATQIEVKQRDRGNCSRTNRVVWSMVRVRYLDTNIWMEFSILLVFSVIQKIYYRSYKNEKYNIYSCP